MSNKNYESHRKAIVSKGIPPTLLNRLTNSDVQVINTFLTRVSKLELSQQEKDWIIKNHLYGLENFSLVAFQGFCVGTNIIESGYSRSCSCIHISKLM